MLSKLILYDEAESLRLAGERWLALTGEGALEPYVVPPTLAHVYCPRVLGQWFDGIRFYAAASSPTRSRRTWAGLR